MSSYLASLASSTTISNLGTRLSSLRRAIASGDEKDDPDNEDSSHISNVLRAYYTEKGRPFPEWLPPDPKAPVPQPRLVATQASLQQGNTGAYAQPQAQYTGRGGGLGDLWGESGPAQPPQSQTASLRSRGGSRTPVAAIGNNNSSNSLRPDHHQHHSQSPSPHSVSRRPLPSQRGESYQSSHSSSGMSDRGASSGGSASERLRARLQGGLGSSSQSPPPSRPQPQQYQAYSSDGGQGQGGYGSSGGSGGYKRPGGLPSGPRPGGYR
jgi:hypothetical protein